MGLGYIIGCMLSIILWKVNKRRFIETIDDKIRRFVRNVTIAEILYVFIISVIIVLLSDYRKNELINAITAFIVIDISNTERKNLNIKDRTHFYDSISTISKALVGGFIAPLFYILFLGNGYGIAYMLLYNICYVNSYIFLKFLFILLTIIPSMLAQLLLYFVYLVRNRKLSIDFKGDYLINCFTRPLLNIDILGAYIEAVNFYYYFHHNDVHYVKSYGEYSNKIDSVCVKDYLSITYGIAMTYFIVFFILLKHF
ncbi:hypothetical protein [Clostridium thermarum]|uniref:hypothetical protein n=1 Tax=Clostridium thermarum TaxID=1716543 RepID=UPI00111D1825|nr:hypothetical protein [Clostridium thermarum]